MELEIFKNTVKEIHKDLEKTVDELNDFEKIKQQFDFQFERISNRPEKTEYSRDYKLEDLANAKRYSTHIMRDTSKLEEIDLEFIPHKLAPNNMIIMLSHYTCDMEKTNIKLYVQDKLEFYKLKGEI